MEEQKVEAQTLRKVSLKQSAKGDWYTNELSITSSEMDNKDIIIELEDLMTQVRQKIQQTKV